jgi:hypothetical protein
MKLVIHFVNIQRKKERLNWKEVTTWYNISAFSWVDKDLIHFSNLFNDIEPAANIMPI